MHYMAALIVSIDLFMLTFYRIQIKDEVKVVWPSCEEIIESIDNSKVYK